MEVCVLASGSGGNSVYISDGTTSLLLDVGLTVRKMQERLEAVGRRPEDIDAIVLSHEHSDHIGGVGPFSRRFKVPLWCAEAVRDGALARYGEFGDVRTFVRGQPFRIGSLALQPFSVPHDSLDPVCFVVSAGTASVGVVTDLGTPTQLVRQKLRQCQLVVLEFNHDPDLLKQGSYPWRTKQRILSRVGHLSNESASELLADVVHTGLRRVVLAHLSEKNNHPELARMHAEQALARASAVQVAVASQHEPTPLYELPHARPEPVSLFGPALAAEPTS
jgi:phosphoribosyl 1,2-cyclic phosphodiesterase